MNKKNYCHNYFWNPSRFCGTGYVLFMSLLWTKVHEGFIVLFFGTLIFILLGTNIIHPRRLVLPVVLVILLYLYKKPCIGLQELFHFQVSGKKLFKKTKWLVLASYISFSLYISSITAWYPLFLRSSWAFTLHTSIIKPEVYFSRHSFMVYMVTWCLPSAWAITSG